MINLINKSIKNDLQSRNPVHVSLAMQCIANIGSKDMAEAFANEIPKQLVSGETLDVVKQSAALCLLRYIVLLVLQAFFNITWEGGRGQVLRDVEFFP